MELLDAALAWALTMGALGTICTILLEVWNRVFKVRGRGLIELVRQHMIQPLLDNKACAPLLVEPPVGPETEEQAKAYTTKKATYTKDVVDAITLCHVGSLGKEHGFFSGRSNASRTYERVSLRHFLLVLTQESAPLLNLLREAPIQKPNALGHDIDGTGESNDDRVNRLRARGVNYQRARGVLMTAAQIYDEASSASSESFRRTAAKWTVAIGVGLALVANIDAVRIFDEYIKNPELAQTIIAESEALEASSAAAEASLEKTRQLGLKLSELHADIVDMETGQASTGDIAEKRAEFTKLEAELKARESADDIANAAATAVAAVQSLQDKGVPIGWDYYPGVIEEPEQKTTEEPCAIATVFKNIRANFNADGSEFVAWLFKVLVTGLLIGLGGPFWFDLARRLALVRRVVSGTTKPAPVDSREANAPADPANPATTAKIVEEVLDHFIAERIPPNPEDAAPASP